MSSASGRDVALDGDADWLSSLPQVIHHLPVGIEVYDRDFAHIFANAVADDLFFSETPIVHHDDWWRLCFPDPVARGSARQEWQGKIDVARGGIDNVQSAEWAVLCRDGLYRIVRFQFRFIDDLYVVVFWDVTDQRRLETSLRQLASSDPLTGVLNRRHFFEVGEAAFQSAAASQIALSVLLIDIDRFKLVNDEYGHRAGDLVLQTVVSRCSTMLAGRGIIGRIGGDEFAVMLPAASWPAAAGIAEQMRDAVAQSPILIGKQSLSARMSVGGAERQPADESLDVLMERADRALYRAKSNGRNSSCFDQPP